MSHQQPDLAWEEQTNPRASRRKGITKMRQESNETGKRKTLEKINATEEWFFKRPTTLANLSLDFLGWTRQKGKRFKLWPPVREMQTSLMILQK